MIHLLITSPLHSLKCVKLIQQNEIGSNPDASNKRNDVYPFRRF